MEEGKGWKRGRMKVEEGEDVGGGKRVLNQGQDRAKRGVSGEAPAALLPEGVLNQGQDRAEARCERGGSGGFAAGGGAEPH